MTVNHKCTDLLLSQSCVLLHSAHSGFSHLARVLAPASTIKLVKQVCWQLCWLHSPTPAYRVYLTHLCDNSRDCSTAT